MRISRPTGDLKRERGRYGRVHLYSCAHPGKDWSGWGLNSGADGGWQPGAN